MITLDLLYGESGKRLEATKRNLYKTFTFGAPPIFTSNHTRIPIEVTEIISLVNRADVVPSLSLGTIEKTLEQISSLDLNSENSVPQVCPSRVLCENM